jgi:hypothetical protein
MESHHHPDRFYKLTYNPTRSAPGVLTPKTTTPRRQTIETIIQSALKKQPANNLGQHHDLLTTAQSLGGIIRPLPQYANPHRRDRFAAAVTPEGHLRILKQIMPSIPFEIVFDVMPDEVEPCVQKSPE